MKGAAGMLVGMCLCAVRMGVAEDIIAANGVTYTNAKISRVEPDGVSIVHTKGISKLLVPR